MISRHLSFFLYLICYLATNPFVIFTFFFNFFRSPRDCSLFSRIAPDLFFRESATCFSYQKSGELLSIPPSLTFISEADTLTLLLRLNTLPKGFNMAPFP